MNDPFHLSIGVKSIKDSIQFFTEVLSGTITHEESSYVNLDLFGHQITLKSNKDIRADLPDFHFGFNMKLEKFNQIAEQISKYYDQYIYMKPKVVDAGTSMERKKMYLKCPTGYLVELKGYH